MSRLSISDLLSVDELDAESIGYQRNSQFGVELEAEINRLRNLKVKTAREWRESNLAAIIKKYTRLKAKLVLDEGENAWAMIPSMTAESGAALTKEYKEMLAQHGFNKKPEKPVIGTVDIKRGIVGGDFEKYSHTIGMGAGFLNNKLFTDAEITGILLHEIGHVMYYYFYLAYSMSTNYYLDYVCKHAITIPREEERIAYLTKAQLRSGDLEHIEEAARQKNLDQMRIIVHTDLFEDTSSMLGNSAYDHRGWEFLADNFATAHGYGTGVASGLRKVYELYGVMPQTSSRLAGLLFFVIAGFATAGLLFLFGAVLLATCDLQHETYDTLRKRFEAIRKNLIGHLREAPPEDRKAIIRQINIMEDNLDGVEEETPNVLVWMQQTFGPSGREKYRNTQVQQHLEHFANSEARLLAERFKAAGRKK